MPSLKIDIIIDDKGRPVINQTTASMKELESATRQADAAMKSKSSSMGGLTTSLLKLYGAYFVLSSAIQGATSLMMSGVNAIDTYNLSIAKMAAMMTGMMKQQPGQSLAQMYKDAYAYAGQLNVMIEQVDKNTLLTAADLRQITEEMMKQGVVVDTNNKKQVESFTAISNALAVIAAGSPNKQIQLRQEMRALLQGELKDSNQLAKMLDAQTGNLKEQIKLHREQGDIIEWLGEQLKGFTAAQDDINSSWEAMKTSLQTIYEQILRDGFQPVFKDLIEATKKLSKWAIDHKEEIAALIKDGYSKLKGIIQDTVGIFAPWKEELKHILGLVSAIFEYIRVGIHTAKLYSEGLKEAFTHGYVGPAALGYAGSYVASKTVEEGRAEHNRKMIDLVTPKGEKPAVAALPKFKPLPADDSKTAKNKYADTVRQIADETKQWEDRIAELNPELDKEDNAILKLTNDIDNAIKKMQDQGAKGGVNVTQWVKKLEGLRQTGIGYIQETAWKKGQEEYEKIIDAEVEYGMNENERAANQIIHQEEMKMNKLKDLWWDGVITDEQYTDAEVQIHDNALAAKLDKETEYAKKVADINYNLIQNIVGMEEWAHELRMQQIEAEGNAKLKDGADPRAVEAFRVDQQMRARIAKSIKGNDFLGGYQAQLEQFKLDMKSAGEFGAEVFTKQHGVIKDSFTTLFEDLRKGELKSWEDYFSDFANKMLSVWEDMLSEMLANWIMTGQMMRGQGMLGGSAGGVAGGIGGLISGLFTGGGSAGISDMTGGWGALFGGAIDPSVNAGNFHEGGIVGEGATMRSVPASAFDNAKRYHNGLLPDEFPAILQKGETVIPKGGLTGGNITVNVPLTVNGGDRKLGNLLRTEIEQTVVRVLKGVA